MAMMAGAPSMEVEQDLPGFRFHPTEEELLGFYLSRVVHGKQLHFDIIGTLNIYRHDPWDLPGTSLIRSKQLVFLLRRSSAVSDRCRCMVLQRWRRSGSGSGTSSCRATSRLVVAGGRTGRQSVDSRRPKGWTESSRAPPMP